MKKALALLLALIMCLSLAACGGGNDTPTQDTTETPTTTEAPTESVMTKEEMIAVAQDIGEDFDKDFEANPVSAEDKYLGNVYYVTGRVNNIESDHIGVGAFTVYLPKEDIINLTKGQIITIVGQLDSVEDKADEYMPTIRFWYGTMTNAYFFTDITEVTGYMCIYNTGTYSACGLDMVNDNVNEVTYSIKHEITPQNGCVTISGTEIQHGTKVTLSGKIFVNTDDSLLADYIINEVELVSIDE